MKHMFGWKKWLPLIHVHLVKVTAVNLRKLILLPLESSQVSHAQVQSILWFGDLPPSFYMYPQHTKPLIDLFKDKKFKWYSRRAQTDMHKTLLYSMMVPNQNSVVFYCKTTMWSCLFGQRVHMYVAEPAHVIVVHFPRISQHHLVGLHCNLSFSDMPSEISCYQPDLNLR